MMNFQWKPFQNINLIGELFKREGNTIPTNPIPVIQPKENDININAGCDANLFHTAGYITNFSRDTLQPTLNNLVQKLYLNKTKKKKQKIRIAYFGDSMIEGDLITGTFRSQMQKEFGGTGVGFVPVKSITAGFRQTVIARTSGNWSEQSFKSDKVPGNLFLSGHLFLGSSGTMNFDNKVITDSAAILEKKLLVGQSNQPITITVNKLSQTITPTGVFNNIQVGSDASNSITLSVPSSSMPIYGISIEGSDGVIVDNFSFRGISGVEFARIDSSFLTAIQKKMNYDLIIFQYGVNLLFRANDKEYSWYSRLFSPVLRKFKNCFPNTDIVVVGVADRAFRYGAEYKSAIGINSLVKEQATMAFANNLCFYNLYETMGGENSMVKWVNQKPPLANKDYIHFNHRGAEVIGDYMFQAIKNEYRKYERLQNGSDN
jgi:lysophospholipase L1-like esterase